MASRALSCSSCGATAEIGARFCTECGTIISVHSCTSCGQRLEEDANFCMSCGASVTPRRKVPNATAVDSTITAVEMALCQAEPRRVLAASLDCLKTEPSSEQAAIASVMAMSSHARLGNFDEARPHLMAARDFYADHLGLREQQRTKFLQEGSLIEDLQEIGCRDLQENPWLYLILGCVGGSPHLPEWYRGKGDSEAVGRDRALHAWADFVNDNREEMFGALAYLFFTNGQYARAADYLERVLLIARKYDGPDPARIEALWPLVVAGDCYWANNQKEKAAHRWQRARSAELTVLSPPEPGSWESFGLSWIEKAKARLADHGIPVPTEEASQQASEHLKRALECLLEAEQFEKSGVDLDELSSLVRRAGRKYTALLEHAVAELDFVEQLDRFTWTIRKEPYHCWRYESIESLLLVKKAIAHLAGDKLALAVAALRESMNLWPVASQYALLAGLLASCGLIADAKSTYQTCIEHIEEFGAVDSVSRDEVLLGIQEGLGLLPS